MAEYVCAICGGKVRRDQWFCYACYQKFKQDIKAREPWTLLLRNDEQRRRRGESKQQPTVYLGDKYDIDDNGNLVFKDYGR
jgi:DNA-directed RNA polymerase subunit RPC12/RpoP